MKDLQMHLTQKDLNLADPIRAKYQQLDRLPPTNNTGSKPIDSIFVSPDLMHISLVEDGLNLVKDIATIESYIWTLICTHC